MKRKIRIAAFFLIIVLHSAAMLSCKGHAEAEGYLDSVRGIYQEIKDTYKELFLIPMEEAQERMEEVEKREEDDNEWKSLYREQAESYWAMRDKFLNAAVSLENMVHPKEYRKNVLAFIEYIRLWARRMDLAASERVLCIDCDMRLYELRNTDNDEYERLNAEADEIQEEMGRINEEDLRGVMSNILLKFP